MLIPTLEVLAPIGALAVLVAVSGCVTSGVHEQVVTERDALAAEQRALEEKLKLIQTSNDALTDELDQTLEQYEDLNIEKNRLEAELADLRDTEKNLSSALEETTVALSTTHQKLEVATSEVERLTSTYTQLMADLESEVSAGQIEIEQLREGIRVNVADDILFPSGSAELDPIGRKVLEKVIVQLEKLDHDIEVQGHTDNLKISSRLAKRYPSNWELAAARAARVVRLMQEGGIPGERLRVVSLASYQPVAPNDSPQNRALNRRIEIRLQPTERDGAANASGSGAGASASASGEAGHAGGS